MMTMSLLCHHEILDFILDEFFDRSLINPTSLLRRLFDVDGMVDSLRNLIYAGL